MRYLFFVLIALLMTNCADSKLEQPSTKTTAKLISNTIPSSKKFMGEPLYVSYDFGSTWENAGKGLPDSIGVSKLGRIGNHQGMAAVNNEIVLATMNDGIYIKKEGAENWQQIGAELPRKQIHRLHIEDEDIYVGIYEEGIFKTIDKGEKWINLTYNLSDLRIQSMTTINGQLLAGTDVGIFKLNEQQKRWKKVYNDVQINSLDVFQGKLIAGHRKGIVLSKDQGETWEWIYENDNTRKAIILDNKIAASHFGVDLSFSDNLGQTWQPAFYLSNSKFSVNNIVQVGKVLLMSTGTGIYRSEDNGVTWILLHELDRMSWLGDFLVSGKVIYLGAGMGGC
ncbi:MAG: hypothetical protein AAGI49_03010 [Bacteroidota bacterium]